MRFVYAILVGAGWVYIGKQFHWKSGVIIVAVLTTITFAYLIARIVEGDLKEQTELDEVLDPDGFRRRKRK